MLVGGVSFACNIDTQRSCVDLELPETNARLVGRSMKRQGIKEALKARRMRMRVRALHRVGLVYGM